MTALLLWFVLKGFSRRPSDRNLSAEDFAWRSCSGPVSTKTSCGDSRSSFSALSCLPRPPLRPSLWGPQPASERLWPLSPCPAPPLHPCKRHPRARTCLCLGLGRAPALVLDNPADNRDRMVCFLILGNARRSETIRTRRSFFPIPEPCCFTFWCISAVRSLSQAVRDQPSFSLAATFGAIGVALVVAGLALTLLHPAKPQQKALATLALYLLGGALLVSLGRVRFGTNQALSSRYSTPVLAFWLATCYSGSALAQIGCASNSWPLPPARRLSWRRLFPNLAWSRTDSIFHWAVSWRRRQF